MVRELKDNRHILPAHRDEAEERPLLTSPSWLVFSESGVTHGFACLPLTLLGGPAPGVRCRGQKRLVLPG